MSGIQISTRLPMPDGKPVPLFFGRRFLTAREVLATGLVRNHETLRRLMAEGRFPQPLLIGRKLRVWDTLELQALIDRLALEREGRDI
jgi:predicted DNA-binding transcriptional regulator AlpA